MAVDAKITNGQKGRPVDPFCSLYLAGLDPYLNSKVLSYNIFTIHSKSESCFKR